MLRPDPWAGASGSLGSIASMIAGRLWRSTIFDATIPITPACQPGAASTYALRSPISLASASASQVIRCSVLRRSAVDRVEFLRDLLGALRVLREQQFEAGVGASHAARGVDPRRQPEGQAGGVKRARIRARDPHQSPQTRAFGAGHLHQPVAHEPAVLAAQRHQVGHGGERDELEVAGSGRRTERLGELVRDRGTAQLRGGIAAEGRMHYRAVGQLAVRARRVMIGDHHIQPAGARDLHLLDRCDPAVDGHQQAAPPIRRGARTVAAARP